MKSIDPAEVAKGKAEIEALGGRPCELVLRPESMFALVGLVQLADRHPSLGGLPHQIARTIVAAAREYFAACPTILEVIARGDDPAFDQPTRPPTTTPTSGGVH